MVSDQLLLQEKQLRYNLLNANEQFKSQKENIEIARRVLKSFRTSTTREWPQALTLPRPITIT